MYRDSPEIKGRRGIRDLMETLARQEYKDPRVVRDRRETKVLMETKVHKVRNTSINNFAQL